MKRYYLKVNDKEVEVSRNVYKAYYQEYEHERYLNKLSIEHECSYDMLRDNGYPIEQHMSRTGESVEEVFIKNETWLEIIGWLQILTPQERNLIIQHYLFDVQQVVLAKINGKSKQAINKNLKKIIKKINKFRNFG